MGKLSVVYYGWWQSRVSVRGEHWTGDMAAWLLDVGRLASVYWLLFIHLFI